MIDFIKYSSTNLFTTIVVNILKDIVNADSHTVKQKFHLMVLRFVWWNRIGINALNVELTS